METIINSLVNAAVSLMQPVGWGIMIIVFIVVEFIKILIPAKIKDMANSKYIFIGLAVIIGIACGIALHNIIQGLLAGLLTTMGYGFLEKNIDKIAEGIKLIVNSNANKTPDGGNGKG